MLNNVIIKLVLLSYILTQETLLYSLWTDFFLDPVYLLFSNTEFVTKLNIKAPIIICEIEDYSSSPKP